MYMRYKLRKYTKSFVIIGRKPMNSLHPIWMYIDDVKRGVSYGLYFANWK